MLCQNISEGPNGFEAHPDYKEHFEWLRAMAMEHSTTIFPGTFNEHIPYEEFHLISNSGLCFTPSGDIKVIRKVIGSDTFRAVDNIKWERYLGGELDIARFLSDQPFYRQQRYEKHGGTPVDPHIYQIVTDHMKQSAQTRAFDLPNGIRVYPLICAETSELPDFFPEDTADLVVEMFAGYRLPLFAIGCIKNEVGFGQLDEHQLETWMKDELADKMISFDDEARYLRPEGVLAMCDRPYSMGAIIYPFSDRNVSNYILNRDFVSGTVYIPKDT